MSRKDNEIFNDLDEAEFNRRMMKFCVFLAGGGVALYIILKIAEILSV